MLKSNNLSSRSTVFSSKGTSGSSRRRRRKRLNKSMEPITLSDTQILAKRTVKDIIEHAIKIADFHLRHKKYQKTYENRKIKREQNFITPDEEFSGYLPKTEDRYDWSFISKLIGKIVYLESNGNLRLYDFRTDNYLLFNLSENDPDKKIISSELYEHEQTATSNLFLLYQDFIFLKIDLLILNKNGSTLSEPEEIINLINLSKKSFFNFKPYLNIPSIDEYFPNYENNIKIIIFPKMIKDYCTDIILNFTQIAGKFLIYNTISNSILGNYIVNQKDYVTTESEYLYNVRLLISAFFEKIWSVKQYEYLCHLIDTICKVNKENKKVNIMEELKKLALLLNMASNDEDDNLSLLLKTQQYTFTEIKDLKTEKERNINSEKLYNKIILPIFIKSTSGPCIITLQNLLLKLKNFFDKLYDCSTAVGKSDLSLIQGRFKLYQTLFLKCYNRGIDLKQLFINKDPNNYGYVDEKVANEILLDLPIGLNPTEVDQLLHVYNLFDENGKYMYDYLFLLDEQIITKIAFSSPLNLLGENKFSCGYFIKNATENNYEINDKKVKNMRPKMSAPTDKDSEMLSLDSQYEFKNFYGNIIEEKGILTHPEKLFNYEELIDYIINSCFTIEITDIIIISSLNLVFLITPFNTNIPIFKKSTKYTNKTQKLEKIGDIILNSFYIHSPLFLYCIEERNLLLTQRTTKLTTEIVYIDISKDLLFPSRDKNTIEYSVSDDINCKKIRNLLTFQQGIDNIKLFRKIEYLKKNQLLALISDEYIFIINPKSHYNEISLKMQEVKKTVYTKLCRGFCENPDEQTGDPKFKLLYKINLTTPLKKFSLFSLGSDLLGDKHMHQYSNTDWLFLLFDTGEISSYCVNQVYLNQKAKEIDTPLTEKEIEQLFLFGMNNAKKSLVKYQNYLNQIYLYYDMLRNKNDETLDQISLRIKEAMLYEKLLNFNPKESQFHTIHQLIFILKMINLKFETNQLFDMFPCISFSRPKYESDAEYFKTELFPKDKNYEELGVDIENVNLPRNLNKLQSDLSSLETSLTVIDSAVKKLAKYIVDKNIQNDKIFKMIDENEEEILDFKQFSEGFEKFGLLSKNYLNNDEMKLLFKKMDANHSNVLTLDEYTKFLGKVDIFSVKSAVINEKQKRLQEKIFDFDVEKFVISSEEEKRQAIAPILEKIQNFYSNIPTIEFNDIKTNLEIISTKIGKNEIEMEYYNGFIFLDDFKNLLFKYMPNMSEEDMNKLFAFFDQNNMNLFIYVRDFVKYLKKKEDEMINIDTSRRFRPIMLKEQFLLIWIAIIKKLLKLCIMELGLSPDDFTEKFILSKKYEKNIIILNYIPTEMAIDNLKKKITNFLPLEEKILFNYYIDYYNFGILYPENLKIMFDNMMKYINDSDIFDLTKYDTFDLENANKYINKQKYNLNDHEKKLEQNYLQNLLPVYDKTLYEFAYYTQKKGNMKDLTLLYNYLRTVGNEKDFLTQKEFMKLLKVFIPPALFDSRFSKNLMNQLSENITLVNEPVRPVISVSRIILFIINIIKKFEIMQPIINIQEISFSDNKKILDNFNKCICRLSQFDSLSKGIDNLSIDYLKIINSCNFSGLILVNKNEIINEIRDKLIRINLKIADYNNYYLRKGNNILISTFNKLLKRKTGNKNIHAFNYNVSLAQNFLSLIELPIIQINVIDSKEMINLKRYQSGMIENFDYFQPELQCIVNVTKIRKKFLQEQKSEDNQPLLNHILHSLKINHYLQKMYLENSDIKSFENFQFLRNFGIYTKEILIDKDIEEELYIVNEKIDLKEYVSLGTLAKSNGGLLFIPEIANTDMGFYILKFWGKSILNIIHEINKINRCFKYVTLKDFYSTYNGRKMKMANIYSYSCYDQEGKMTFGPDIFKILLLLDKLQTCEEDKISYDILDNIYSNDAYIAPEFIKKINEDGPNYQVDSWLYGVLMYNIIFGVTPKTFYSQLNIWSNTFLGESIKQVLDDDSFDVLNCNFFFNPFINIKEMAQDKKYFSKVLRQKSFAAIIKTDDKKSNNNSNYDIWTFVDLINACLSIDPEKRPSISSLINFDLFDIDYNLFSLYQRGISNVMEYYSPDSVIKEKMVIPLREICCEIIRNQESKPYAINNYQNYILNVIRELNTYMFSKAFSSYNDNKSIEGKESVSSTNESYEDHQDQFMNSTSKYKYKNSVLVKYVVDYKVVDLLIFLVIRYFNINLKLFKQKMKKEINNNSINNNVEEEKNNYSNYNMNMKNIENSLKNKSSNSSTCSSFTDNNIYLNQNYYIELNNYCGKLLTALVDFLYNCVQSLNSYEHVLSLYVENVLIWIIKLFIGEENDLLGNICDILKSNDKMKKYIYYRTFLRDENIVIQNDFQEDELDQVFSIMNSNKQIIEIKSSWTPELYYFVNKLFRECFGENCSGSFKHSVIKNYFLAVNTYTQAENKLNPLSKNNEILNFISASGINKETKVNYKFINTDYVSELLTIIEIMDKLSDKTKNYRQMIQIKKDALNYVNIVFKTKNSSKIRGVLDCKFHFLIQEYLYTNINELEIKKELFNILKEISLCLLDLNEISWLFGNNYEKIYGENKIKNKNSNILDLESNPYINESSWDPNVSLVDFSNEILTQPHSFVLSFTNKFLKINIQNDITTYASLMKEFGYIFSSPLLLKPIMHCLQMTNENYQIRQLCLEILFNLLMSNEVKITSNLNMTMSNFYEILVDLIYFNPFNSSSSSRIINSSMKKIDNFEIGEKEKYFKESIAKIIKIIVEMQNPDIKRQIFNCSTILRYIKKNKLFFVPRLELDEIDEQFDKIKNSLNFDNLEGRIIFLIDSFKNWVYENNINIINDNLSKIRNIITVIDHIFNNEWTNGLKTLKKNCLVFDIVKLYEWLMLNNHKEFLFPKNSESFTSKMIVNFLSKVKENGEIMKKLVLELNRISAVPKSEKNNPESRINYFGNSIYNLNKIYNYISIQLLNIIYTIFSLGDNYYNSIFNKMKTGLLLSEIFILQLETLSLFLAQENIDISILNNYIPEVKIRLGLIETISLLPKAFDDIKMQFLQSNFINYVFKYMIDDNRKFRTNSKKLSIDFLPYKSTYPLRNESIVFIDIFIKKYYNLKKRTETDCFLFDEIIRNVKVFHLVQNQLAVIKTKIKGDEVLSILDFFNMILSNNEREIIKIMNTENAKDYFIYALQKETSIKKMFPFIVEYIDKVRAGIEK